MSNAPNLDLPLLAAAQAQKHVTVNEALVRLDALAAPTALTLGQTAPPAGAPGDMHVVGFGATGAWVGHDGELAFWVNDGWSFAAPRPGWRVWVEDRRAAAVHDGSGWTVGLVGPHISGAYTQVGLLTGDIALSGTVATGGLVIPDRAIVLGVTARVLADIAGAGVTGWRIGVAGAEDRYGTGIGLVKDSTANGVTGAPVAYYADTPLEVRAEGGAFDGGAVRLAIHLMTLTPPDAV